MKKDQAMQTPPQKKKKPKTKRCARKDTTVAMPRKRQRHNITYAKIIHDNLNNLQENATISCSQGNDYRHIITETRTADNQPPKSNIPTIQRNLTLTYLTILQH